MAKKNSAQPVIVCQPKFLPRTQWTHAAKMAATIDPINAPAAKMAGLGRPLKPAEIANSVNRGGASAPFA